MAKPVGSFWKRVDKRGINIVSGYVEEGCMAFKLSPNKFKEEGDNKPDFVAWPADPSYVPAAKPAPQDEVPV